MCNHFVKKQNKNVIMRLVFAVYTHRDILIHSKHETESLEYFSRTCKDWRTKQMPLKQSREVDCQSLLRLEHCYLWVARQTPVPAMARDAKHPWHCHLLSKITTIPSWVNHFTQEQYFRPCRYFASHLWNVTPTLQKEIQHLMPEMRHSSNDLCWV